MDDQPLLDKTPKQIIGALMKMGMTTYEIADELSKMRPRRRIWQSVVADLHRGRVAQPRYKLMDRLRALFEKKEFEARAVAQALQAVRAAAAARSQAEAS